MKIKKIQNLSISDIARSKLVADEIYTSIENYALQNDWRIMKNSNCGITSIDGVCGLEFKVRGSGQHGRIRIWKTTPMYYDVEIIRMRSEVPIAEMKKVPYIPFNELDKYIKSKAKDYAKSYKSMI